MALKEREEKRLARRRKRRCHPAAEGMFVEDMFVVCRHNMANRRRWHPAAEGMSVEYMSVVCRAAQHAMIAAVFIDSRISS